MLQEYPGENHCDTQRITLLGSPSPEHRCFAEAATHFEAALALEHGALHAHTRANQADLEERYLFSSGRRVTVDELSGDVGARLAGTTSPDALNVRPGILLVPQNTTIPCRVWVQFPKPRRYRLW